MKATIIIMSLFILGACQAQKNVHVHEGESGIKGKIIWVSGNQMPTIQPDGQAPLKKEPQGIVRTIEIYAALKTTDLKGDGSFFEKPSVEPAAIVTSNEKGEFHCHLSPGKYSVFTVEPQGRFANSFDGQNFVQPVVVNEAKFSEITIEVNYSAAY